MFGYQHPRANKAKNVNTWGYCCQGGQQWEVKKKICKSSEKGEYPGRTGINIKAVNKWHRVERSQFKLLKQSLKNILQILSVDVKDEEDHIQDNGENKTERA